MASDDIRSFFGGALKSVQGSKRSAEGESGGVEKKKREEEDWSDGVPYSKFAETCGRVEAISGRLEITQLLTNFFSKVLKKHPEDLVVVLYLFSKEVAPAFENVELGIGEALLYKAIGAACGKQEKAIKEDASRLGDLGLAAENARSKQRTLSFGAKPKPLTVTKVLSEFRALAKISGSKSQDQKVGKMCRLLTAATPSEARYLVRALAGKMRIHLGNQTVLTALAHSVASSAYSKEQAEHIVKACYAEHPVLDALAQAATELPDLNEWRSRCKLTVGVPVQPMCAKAEKQVTAVLKRFAKRSFACEHKYDGERLQAHYDAGTVKLFSRNCQDTTQKWPDVVEYVKKAATNPHGSFILDAEVVAVDPNTNLFAPFQILSTRKKKDVEKIEVPVVVMAFDLLFLDGSSLLQKSFRERRDLLVKEGGPLAFDRSVRRAEGVDVQSTDDDDERSELIGKAMEVAIAEKVEGLMIKTLDDDATYEPQKRSLNWLKLKKDYLDQFMADSFDLVVVGAYHGKGKRTGVLGSYLLACFDSENDTFQTVCKVATGFSEKDLQELDEYFSDKVIPSKLDHVLTGAGLQQNVVWLEPSTVFEIRAADLSLSSSHTGALGKLEAGRGIGLRFPRFDRKRDDKGPEDATTADMVLDAYLDQDSVKKGENGGADSGDDEDDDGYL